MQVKTAHSTFVGAEAVDDICEGLGDLFSTNPSFAAVHFNAGQDAKALQSALAARWPGTALHGATSCKGILTDRGVFTATGTDIGVFVIDDPDGDYGTASASLGSDAFVAAAQATDAALIAAGRPGETPAMVWLSVAPGHEELVLQGIKSVVGQGCIIVGGSAADNDISGKWAVFGPQNCHGNGVVVSVLFPSAETASIFQYGYSPTNDSGIATRVSGRTLLEIDNRPASHVYAEWSGIAPALDGSAPRRILAEATFHPLGRVAGYVSSVPFHLLAHPSSSSSDGALALFADVEQGERLWHMASSPDGLITRAGRVANLAKEQIEAKPKGALVVYCGGMMLAVQDRLPEVQAQIAHALGEACFIGIFTFGEQGVVPGGQACHGNLMISCTVFG